MTMQDLGPGIGLPVSTANGGTGLSAIGTAHQPLKTNAAADGLEFGTLPATVGGTGQTSYAVGDMLYASSTTALSKLNHPAVGFRALRTTSSPNGYEWVSIASLLDSIISSRGALMAKAGANTWAALAIGTSGYVLRSDGTDPAWAELALPTRYVSGLVIRYASTTTFTVSAGKARDKSDAANMTLSSLSTADVTTVGALGGERKTLSGTSAFTSGSKNVDGTSTTYLSDFGTRALGVTGTSSGTTMTASASVLGLVAVDDLIGHSSKGFFRVTAIASAGTSITLSATPGSAFAGEALSVIENPRIETAAGKVYRVDKITADSGAAALLLVNNANGTEATNTAYSTSKKTNPVDTSDGWRAVWLVSGGSGTSVIVSTQRTTPYCAGSGTFSPTGYGTSYRRIGWVRINSVGNLLPAYYMDGWPTRVADYESKTSISDLQLLLNVALTTSWQTVVASTAAPPTSRRVVLGVQLVDPNVVGYTVLRGRGQGDSGSTVESFRAVGPPTSTSTRVYNTVLCPTDAAQCMEIGSTVNTGDGSYLAVLGYEDTLE